MRAPRKVRRILVLPIVLICLSVFLMASSLSEGYSLIRWTVDSGGGQSVGGNYTLSGTGGQQDAGAASGSEYQLKSGFWSATIQLTGYTLLRSIAIGGGGTAYGGSYQLVSTTGQGITRVSGGDSYTLSSGFWGGLGQSRHYFLMPKVYR